MHTYLPIFFSLIKKYVSGPYKLNFDSRHMYQKYDTIRKVSLRVYKYFFCILQKVHPK